MYPIHVMKMVLLLSFFASICKGDLITDFNSENGGVGVLNYTALADFDVTAGSIDLIGNGLFDFQPGNGLYVDLSGSTNQGGTLTSKISIGPGVYVLKYDLYNRFENSGSVSLGVFTQTFSSVNFSFETFESIVAVNSPTNLIFQSFLDTNDGPIIDNVSLTSVPEPSTLVFVGSLVLFLCMLRRRAWPAMDNGTSCCEKNGEFLTGPHA